jgi:hypothetical protein
MTPSTGERRPRPPPPSPPTRASGGFRPACLAYNTLTYLRQQQLPAPLATPLQGRWLTTLHSSTTTPWRCPCTGGKEHPVQATLAPPPRRRRTQQRYHEERSTHLASTSPTCTQTGHSPPHHTTGSTHGQAEPEALYHNPTLTMDVRRYKCVITVEPSVVICGRQINRRYFTL